MKSKKDEELLKEKTISAIKRSARRTDSLEVFGNNIVNEALQQAVDLIKKGKPTPLKVSLDLTIDICPPFPPNPIPDPFPEITELDICYEICGSMQCYVNCSAPSVGPVEPFRTCEELWKDYRNASNIYEKMKYFTEIVKKGCLKPDNVAVAELERVFSIIDKSV